MKTVLNDFIFRLL